MKIPLTKLSCSIFTEVFLTYSTLKLFINFCKVLFTLNIFITQIDPPALYPQLYPNM